MANKCIYCSKDHFCEVIKDYVDDNTYFRYCSNYGANAKNVSKFCLNYSRINENDVTRDTYSNNSKYNYADRPKIETQDSGGVGVAQMIIIYIIFVVLATYAVNRFGLAGYIYSAFEKCLKIIHYDDISNLFNVQEYPNREIIIDSVLFWILLIICIIIHYKIKKVIKKMLEDRERGL